MSDAYDFTNAIDTVDHGAATGALASVNGVKPQDAAAGATYGPLAGLPPPVAMRVPDVAKQTATARQQQAALSASPELRNWVATAPPDHVAASQDSLPHMANLAGNLKAFGSALLTSVATFAGLPNPAAVIGSSFDIGAGLFATPQQQEQLTAGRRAILGATTEEQQAQVGLEHAPENIQERAFATAGGSVPYLFAGPLAAVLSGVGSFGASEAARKLGANPSWQALAGFAGGLLGGVAGFRPHAVAEADVATVKGLRTNVEAAPITAHSPEVVENFVNHVLPEQSVQVDPATLANIIAKGQDPFPERAVDTAVAQVSGEPVEVPLGRYLTATAKQPFADELDNTSVFREGGLSAEEARATPIEGASVSAAVTPKVEGKERFTAEGAPLNLTKAEEATIRAHGLAAQQALDASFLRPLIESPEAVGMTKDEFTRYSQSLEAIQSRVVNQMQARAMATIMAERKPEFQAAAAAHAEAVRAELESHPLVRATRQLSQVGFKLDRDLVGTLYPDQAEKLPSTILRRGGNHPDEAAEALGFSSGREMVEGLARLHGVVQEDGERGLNGYLKTRVKELSEADTRKALGYDLSPASNYEAASALVHAPDVSRFLSDELKQLNPAFNKYDVDNFVRERFEALSTKLGANTVRIAQLAYKNGVKAQQALQKGDVVGGFKARQAQYIQHEMVSRSVAFAKELRQGNTLFTRVAENVNLATVDQEALNVAKTILASTGREVKGSPTDLEQAFAKYGSLDKYAAAKNNKGAQIILAPIPKADVGAMTVHQFQGLRDLVSSVVEWGKQEHTVEVQGKRLALDDLVQQGVKSLNRYSRTITEEERSSPNFMQQIDATRRAADAWLVRMDQLMRDFGARDPRSPFFTAVSGPLYAAEAESRTMRTWLAGHFRDLNADVGKGWQDWLKHRLPTDGAHKFVATTRAGDPIFNQGKDIAIAAMHMGDEEALRKFAEGYNATPQDIENVVHQFATPQMWKYVQGMWAAFDHFKPDIEAMYKRKTGVTPTMIEARAFTLLDGTVMKGGYMPVLYDRDLNPKEFLEQLEPDEMLGEKHYVRATPANAYIKERTGYAGAVERNIGAVYSRLNQVIHDLSFREALEGASKFLSHPDIQEAISRKYGPEYIGKLQKDLQHIAGSEASDTNNNQAIRKAVDWLTEGQMVNMIGFSPTTIMKHTLTVIPQAIREVGPARYSQAYGDFLVHHDERMAQAVKESPTLRNMVANYGEDSYRQFLDLTEHTNISNQIRSYAYHGIANIQRHVGTALYFAAKQKLEDQFPGMSEAHLQQAADQVVRQVMGSAGTVSAPESLRANTGTVAGAFYRMQNNFLTFLSHMYNRSREIPQALGYGGGDKVDLGRAMSLTATMIVLPILVDQEVAHQFKKGLTDLGMWGEGMIHQFTSPVPGLNSTVSAGMHIATNGQYPTEDNAVASFGTEVGNVWKDVLDLAKGKPFSNRMVQHMLIAGGAAFKYPGLEASRLEGFLHDLAQGGKPLDQIAHDIIYGPPPQRRGDSDVPRSTLP